MKVRLVDILPEGLQADFELKGVPAADLGPQVARVLAPPRASLLLERQGDKVLARGSFKATLELTCSRCLALFRYELAGELELVFLPSAQAAGEETRLAADELEVSFYAGEEIDLGQALMSEIGLALPMAPRCREDCTGLCPKCGRKLSAGACGCKVKEIDPRLAKLAQWKEPGQRGKS